jgi:hypothetical protein
LGTRRCNRLLNFWFNLWFIYRFIRCYLGFYKRMLRLPLRHSNFSCICIFLLSLRCFIRLLILLLKSWLVFISDLNILLEFLALLHLLLLLHIHTRLFLNGLAYINIVLLSPQLFVDLPLIGRKLLPLSLNDPLDVSHLSICISFENLISQAFLEHFVPISIRNLFFFLNTIVILNVFIRTHIFIRILSF